MFKRIEFVKRFAHCKLPHEKVQLRWKNGPDHWSSLANKKTAKDKALEHFDDFYKNIFKQRWPSIRVALLTTNKYIAVVNNFSDSERITPYLENLGAINIRRLFEVEAERLQNSNRKRRKRTRGNQNADGLGNKMEKLSEEKLEEELSTIYPETPEVKDETRSVQIDDESRLIDPELGMSSGSLYEFVPATKLKGMENWLPESQHYSYYKTDSDFPVNIIEQDHLIFPPHLMAYTFESGNASTFPASGKGDTGVTDYYMMDGGSLLPVLALDLQPGDEILDMCAAPGGKSFLCLQSLYPKKLHSNDVSISRLNRVKRVMQEFFYDYNKRLESGELEFSSKDGTELGFVDTFNKILVDVPCTNDRLSVNEEDNNIFNQARIKERIKIPEIQTRLLSNALTLVKKGGTVVYSTCSLSPIQNDGVVHMALKKIWEETNCKIAVVDMKRALEPTEVIYKYSHDIGLRYGHLIRPYLPANFGPMYFCKFVKID